MKKEKHIKLIALLKAKPGVSREDFAKRWLEEHVPLTMKFKNLKSYRINIATDAYQETDELPFDGTAEMCWDSIEQMKEDFCSEAAIIAVADADLFTIIRQHIYTEEYIIK